jgi:signal transduction histidine kinase
MSSPKKPDSFLQKIFNSSWFSFIANKPPISWISYWGTRYRVRREINPIKLLEETVVQEPAPRGNDNHLERIVYSVVNDLGYVAAFLAPYEQGDVLPIRALHIHQSLISKARVQELEEEISALTNTKLSFTDPEVARVYRYEPRHRTNLSIRAVESGEPIIDKELFSLFTPIVPDAAHPILRAIQDELNIKEVVAVPFTIDYYDEYDETHPEKTISYMREIVGNLFAVKTSVITEQDINILKAFGYQAAAAIQNNYSKMQAKIAQKLISNLQRNAQSQSYILQEIVKVIVKELQYAGAMVSTLDSFGTLKIRTYRIAKNIYSNQPIPQWLDELSELAAKPIDLNNLQFTDMDINNEANANNLAYKVLNYPEVHTTTSLYELFCPMLPFNTREKIADIQVAFNIKTIIAIPLLSYQIPVNNNVPGKEVIGILYVASRSRGFTLREVELLKTIGEQVGNAQIYSLSEKRRQTSETFARMAFNVIASIHVLRGHLGILSTALHYSAYLDDEDIAMRETALEFLETGKERLRQAANLLDQLDQPFIDVARQEINIIACIKRASEKLDMEINAHKIELLVNAPPNLPTTYAFREMLVEIFRIIIKKAVDAISRVGRVEGRIEIITTHLEKQHMIQIEISDNGLAMSSEELEEIFDIHDDFRDRQLGFGLFWSHDYLKAMGGKITVKSIAKRGTTFTLNIPIRKQPASEVDNLYKE